MQDKQSLREHYREVRGTLAMPERVEADSKIALSFWDTDEYKGAKKVFCYVSIGEDVDTSSTFVKAWEDGKTIAIPLFRQASNNMEFYEVTSIDAMHHGQFGSRHSQGYREPAVPSADDICIVPCLCVDETGQRLGTGSGFYDRWLVDFPGKAVCLMRDNQVTSEPLPREDHDVPMALIVTETRVIRP